MGIFRRIWNFLRSLFSGGEKAAPALEQTAAGTDAGASVRAELEKARTEKRAAQNTIKSIDDWSRDAVVNAFAAVLPNGNLSYNRNQYKAQALEKLPQWKQDYAQKIDPSVITQCEQVLEGYAAQRELNESQVKLLDKLQERYTIILNKIDASKKLSGHQDRISQMDQKTDQMLVQGFTHQHKLEDIMAEFEQQKEYARQLAALKQEYGDNSSQESSKAFKAEIDRMLQQV